jgi:hypothetical protein
MEEGSWSVFMNGRIQAFVNYNDGNGQPRNVTDGLGRSPIQLRGGGVEAGDALPEYPAGTNLQSSTDQGHVQELRIRTGFTGNVLGFGIKKKLSDTTEILGYSAVTVGIDADARRKFNVVRPDWRDSYLRVTGPWGSLSAGRLLTLHSRGATEITYLYGYRYGLGFPGTVSQAAQSTAGSVGFGVLGNGWGSGLLYATPDLGGLQVSAAVFDANNIVGTRLLERTRWPRPEAEITYEAHFGDTGLLKLFGNGAWQKVYDYDGTPRNVDVWGAGYGARIEVGPVHLGLAGHYGKGIGVTYSLEPHQSLYFTEIAQNDPTQDVQLRNVDGYYAQLQVVPTKTISLMAGYGITRVHQLDVDKVENWRPATDPLKGSVGYITIRQQTGIGLGINYHASENLHLALEYFRASFEWYVPVPAPADTANPSQTLNFVSTGVTYEF